MKHGFWRLVAAVLLAWTQAAATQSTVRIHFLDVGQGDAVLIQSPSGQTVLYDGGDSPSKMFVHLEALRVERLDLVVASHNHADHIGGLAEVIRRFRPRFYLDNGLAATTITYRRTLDAVAAAGTQVLEPAHREIRLGADASLAILPPSGIKAWDQNDNAVGAILTVGRFRLSLGGDAESRQWEWWLQNYPALLTSVQVHKASHHGSNHGDTESALARLRPETVVISVGATNTYGHPYPDALRLYAQTARAILRTDINGTVRIDADPSGNYTTAVEHAAPNDPRPSLLSRPYTVREGQ